MSVHSSVYNASMSSWCQVLYYCLHFLGGSGFDSAPGRSEYHG